MDTNSKKGSMTTAVTICLIQQGWWLAQASCMVQVWGNADSLSLEEQ